MKKVVSFIRINKNNEEYTQAQLVGIVNYIKENNLTLEKSIEVEINRPEEEDKVFEILEACQQGCVVVVYDINVFGRTISTILENIQYLLAHDVRIISVAQKLDFINNDDMLTKMILSVMKMSINLEKDLMSLRTKEALSAKKLDGVSLGKPKGTIQKSKFDEQRDKIEELLAVGLSVRKIAKLLGYNNHIGLNNYVKKRHIREDVEQEHKKIAS